VKRWHGLFNYQGEMWCGVTSATTQLMAFHQLTKGLSLRYGISHRKARLYFRDKPNHEVHELKEEYGTKTES
jgi:hypothetical protein